MTHLTPLRVPDTARIFALRTESMRPCLFQQALRTAMPMRTDLGTTLEGTVRLRAGYLNPGHRTNDDTPNDLDFQ